MSSYFLWFILSAITGSPVLSGIAVLILWFGADRFTLGVLPDPFSFLAKRRREWKLRRDLISNKHDRRARLELAQLLTDRKASRQAMDMLRPNLDYGDDDIETVFTMGRACIGAGYAEQGEKLLAHVLELDHDFRVGEVHLVLGRGRLHRDDFQGAKTELELLVNLRKGSVEGRVLLARALMGLKDDANAALMRDQAWDEYRASPRFQQRKERLWAWRARPSRPLIYLGAIVLVLLVVRPVIQQALAGVR